MSRMPRIDERVVRDAAEISENLIAASDRLDDSCSRGDGYRELPREVLLAYEVVEPGVGERVGRYGSNGSHDDRECCEHDPVDPAV